MASFFCFYELGNLHFLNKSYTDPCIHMNTYHNHFGTRHNRVSGDEGLPTAVPHILLILD